MPSLSTPCLPGKHSTTCTVYQPNMQHRTQIRTPGTESISTLYRVGRPWRTGSLCIYWERHLWGCLAGQDSQTVANKLQTSTPRDNQEESSGLYPLLPSGHTRLLRTIARKCFFSLSLVGEWAGVVIDRLNSTSQHLPACQPDLISVSNMVRGLGGSEECCRCRVSGFHQGT